MTEERLKIAVFIDFDNIEIGVKTTLNQHFDVGTVLEAIKERGEVVTKFAYGDWTRAGEYGRAMSQHAIHMVQRNLTPGGDKNGADINLALDALEMAFTHEHINTFVIVGGDSDFISLVEKLKQYDRKVLVVGGRAFTSVVMQKNCTEFIAYENLISRGRAPQRGGRSNALDLSQAMPLVKRAVKLLADREVLPQLGLLKSTLLQLDSAFSERDYGAGSFRDFVQKLANAGFVALKGSERSFHVELRDGGADAAAAAPPAAPREQREPREHREPREPKDQREPREHREHREPREPRDAREPREPREPQGAPMPDAVSAESAPVGAPSAPDAEEEAPAAVPSAGESLRNRQGEGYQLLESAVLRQGAVSRWPLYVRQVKQLLRQVDDQFDERRFGFSGLVDMLRFGQREGLLRLDRDRMGVVRVYPGQNFPKPAAAPGGEPLMLDVDEGHAADTESGVADAAAPSLFDDAHGSEGGGHDTDVVPSDEIPTTTPDFERSEPAPAGETDALAQADAAPEGAAPADTGEQTAAPTPARGRTRSPQRRGQGRARKTTGTEKEKKPAAPRGRAPRGRKKPAGPTE